MWISKVWGTLYARECVRKLNIQLHNNTINMQDAKYYEQKYETTRYCKISNLGYMGAKLFDRSNI